MRVRPLAGPQGDMVPVRSLNQMLEGPEAVAQIVAMRIGLNRGEWWENEDAGFHVPDFLAETARRSDLDMLAKYIASYIRVSEGVDGVDSATIEYEDHKAVFRCRILTTGGSRSVEVNLNGIL